MRRLALFSVLTLFAAVSARAEEPTDRAAERFEAGEDAFARGEFITAAEAFEEAAELSPHPAAWLNAAEAWERAGELVRAREDCERARALAGGDPAVEAEVDRRLGRLEPRLGQLELGGSPALRVAIDGGEAEPLPLQRWVMPGDHVLELEEPSSGRRRTEHTAVAAGETRRLELEIEAPPPVAAAPVTPGEPELRSEDERFAGPPPASWACFAVGGAALVSASILGGLTLSAQSGYERAPSQPAADTFHDRRLATNVSWTVALVGAGAGLVVWLLTEEDPATDPELASASLRF